MSWYAEDGSWNVTFGDGTSGFGVYASDGSVAVYDNSEGDYNGFYAPDGSINTVPASLGGSGRFASNGSLRITSLALDTTYIEDGAQKVTEVT